jgi:putative tricarboxylic transport membrane protein
MGGSLADLALRRLANRDGCRGILALAFMPMLTTDRIGGSALCLLALFVMWESRTLPLGTWRNPGPGYFPVLLAALLLILGVLIWAMGGHAPAIAGVGWGEARHAVVILAVSAFICLALERLGYRLTMLAALLFLVWLVERKSLWTAAVFALALSFGSYYLFDTLLRVPLPRGPFGI